MNYVGSVKILFPRPWIIFMSEIILVCFIFTFSVHFYFKTVCRNPLFVDIDYGEIVQFIYQNFVTYLFIRVQFFVACRSLSSMLRIC